MLTIVLCASLLMLSAIMALLLLIHHALLWYYDADDNVKRTQQRQRAATNPVFKTEKNKRKFGLNQSEMLTSCRNRFYSESSSLRCNPRDSKMGFHMSESKTLVERSRSFTVDSATGCRHRRDSYSLRFENSRSMRRDSNVWYTMKDSICGRYELQMRCEGPTRKRSYRLVPHTKVNMNNKQAHTRGPAEVEDHSRINVDRELCQSSYHIGSSKFTVTVKQKSTGTNTV